MLEPQDLCAEVCTAISYLSLKVLIYFVVNKYLILKGGADEHDAQHHKLFESLMRHLEASRADTPRTDEFNSWGLGSSAARGGE